MKCFNCESEIPGGSRFCLNCGAPQAQSKLEAGAPVSLQTAAADGQQTQEKLDETEEMDWLAREAELNPNLDYDAQRRFNGWAEQGLGCLVTGLFVVMGLVAFVPTVPILAVIGIPLAFILAPLTYFNVAHLQERFKQNRWLQKLPGFKSSKPPILALSVFFYLGGVSAFCYLLLAITLRR